MIRLILITRLVSAPLPRVELVMQAAERAGVDASLAVAVVAVESRFDPAALGDDGHAHGLWQGHDRWHPDFGDDLIGHCNYFSAYLSKCIAQEKGSWTAGIARYNSGSAHWASGRSHAAHVMALYRLVAAQGFFGGRSVGDGTGGSLSKPWKHGRGELIGPVSGVGSTPAVSISQTGKEDRHGSSTLRDGASGHGDPDAG